MARKRRRDVIDESVVGVYHIWTRTARSEYALGYDPDRKEDFSHRKVWIEQRLKALVSVFAVECCDYAILDNHLHLILRNRPDVARNWDDRELARRWLMVNRSALALEPEPSADEIRALCKDKKKMVAIRAEISSVSMFLGCLKQPVSIRANIEDEVPGVFWSSRFGARRLENEESLLVCSMYVNMNPIRAGKAQRLEDVEHSSLTARLKDRVEHDATRKQSGWLAAVHEDGDGFYGMEQGLRASNRGYLRMTFDDQLQLLEELVKREKLGEIFRGSRSTRVQLMAERPQPSAVTEAPVVTDLFRTIGLRVPEAKKPELTEADLSAALDGVPEAAPVSAMETVAAAAALGKAALEKGALEKGALEKATLEQTALGQAAVGKAALGQGAIGKGAVEAVVGGEQSILQRLGIDRDEWETQVRVFSRRFGRELAIKPRSRGGGKSVLRK